MEEPLEHGLAIEAEEQEEPDVGELTKLSLPKKNILFVSWEPVSEENVLGAFVHVLLHEIDDRINSCLFWITLISVI